MLLKQSFLIALAIMASACGAFSKKDSAPQGPDQSFSQPNGSGCVQGVVVDGITGKRIPLNQKNDKGETRGVAVLVHNHIVSATPMVQDTAAGNPELVGEYSLCGFPLDETFPIFAWVDGYENFEGAVHVSSTIAQKTPNSEQMDIPRKNPTMLANIKIYPKGTETKDLKFTVQFDGKSLEGAQVQLHSTAKNILDQITEKTLAPQIRLVPQTASTNSNGEVTFAASSLVLGGVYEYTILPPNGGDEIAMAKGMVTVGLRSPGLPLSNAPYEVKVTLSKSK